MLNITVDQARKIPKTTIRCNVTAPMALVAFMESTDFESAIRNAVYIGGDTDTNAAIAGAIAEAYYKEIPRNIVDTAMEFLPIEFKDLISKFYETIKY
jgi:ADP-ribosylglycohydrolase